MLEFARTTPFAATNTDILNNVLQAIGEDQQSFVIRAGLSALVILLALSVGRWLARWTGRAPIWGDALLLGGTGPGRAERRAQPRRRNRLLEALTNWSLLLLALLALVAIWLTGRTLTVDPTEILRVTTTVVVRLGISALVMVATLIVARIVAAALDLSLQRGRVNRNLRRLVGRTAYVATLLAGVVVILALWGTGIVLPVTLLGVLTVALSLALQDILKNLVAGIYLLIERPFVIGDQITMTPYSGEVEDIQIRVTTLRTVEGERVLIPNALLFTTAVVNQSFYRLRRVGLRVTIPDGGQKGISRVEEQILSALGTISGVLEDPAPQVTLNRASGGKMDLHVAFWLPTQKFGQQAEIVSEAIERLRAQVQDAEVAPLDAAPTATA